MSISGLTLGLDISDRSLEAVELGADKKIIAYGRAMLASGIVKDGEIIDKQKLSQAVVDLLTRAGIKAKKTTACLPVLKVFTHLFTIPPELKETEWDKYIKSVAEKTIPIESDKLRGDYYIFARPDKQEKKNNCLYACVYREIVDSYQEALTSAGLEVEALEIEQIALARVLRDILKNEVAIIIVDIGAATTSVCVIKNLFLEEVTAISVAGDNLTGLLAKELQIPEAEAEKLKLAGKWTTEQQEKIDVAIKIWSRPIFDKLVNLIRFYNQPIAKILLVGGSSLLSNIANHFFVNLKINTEAAVAETVKTMGQEAVFYHTAAGLALRRFIKDNSLPEINLLAVSSKVSAKKGFFYFLKSTFKLST